MATTSPIDLEPTTTATSVEPRFDAGRDSRGNATSPGRGALYYSQRLQREAPQLWAQVKRGKLSVHAASIRAGIRKQLSPIEQAQRVTAQLDKDSFKEFFRWVLVHAKQHR